MINIEYNCNIDLSAKAADTTVLDFSPIPFCFVGARGVGKTSLLTSMYKQIKDANLVNFSIDPTTEAGNSTEERLSEAHEKMLEMIEETKLHAIAEEELGLTGSTDIRYFEISGEQTVRDTDVLKLSDFKKFRYKFGFTDLPGEYFTGNAEERQKAQNVLQNSLVSFLAVDTPALMSNRLKNMRSNKIESIGNMYYHTEWTQQHTVIIVLSRCEKYWNQRNEMLNKLREHYEDFYNILKSKNIRVFVTWVKTLGGMEFSHYTKEDRNGKTVDRAHFKRIGNYEPENCATPLQLALEYGLSQLSDLIKPGLSAKLGLSNEELAKKATEELALELRKTLHAGNQGTYMEL